MTAKVHRLELVNFKSYNGKVTVGPFNNFDCIVGPNGSGKSNVMDALSFVLGSAANTLRMSKAADLINNKCKKNECSVSLVLKVASGQETTLTRKVNAKGEFTVAVNGKITREDEFTQVLRKHKIGARTSSFLVFQHEVDALAQKKAKELTELIEEVSGSGQLKAEYTGAKKEMDKANEELSNASVTKRTAIAEVNQMRLHKKEAERFNDVNNQLQAERRDLALTELFHIEVQLGHQKASLDAQNAEAAALQATITTDGDIQKMKKEYGEQHKEYLNHLKVNRESSIEMREKKSTLDRIKTSIEHFTKRKEKESEELHLAMDNKNLRSKETTRLEEQLAHQQKALKDFEKNCQEEDIKAATQGKLTADQQIEYKKLKKDADCETITQRQEREILRRKGDALGEAVKQLTLAQENQEASKKETTNLLGRNEDRIQDYRAKIAEIEQSMADLKAKAESSRGNLAQVNTRQQQREQRLTDVQAKLNELRHTKDDSRHAERMADALQSLRSMHSGVRGRLVDLCSIPNPNHRGAVTVAMGKNLEALVVDTTATAMACVRYLKEQRISAMTFIPLNNIQGKDVDDRLRTLGGTCKPIVDCIKAEGWLMPAIKYAVGQCLVCDTVAEARKVAFGQSNGERYKVVTLDGSMLLKNGSIQGGQSTVESRARKWDEGQYDNLKAERDKLAAEAGTGAEQARSLVDVREAESNLDFAKRRATTVKEDIATISTRNNNLKAELKRQEGQAKEIASKLKDANAQVAKVDEDKKKLQVIIKAKEDKIYGSFAKKVGIPNVSELEERDANVAKSRAVKKQGFDVLIHKLKTSLEAEVKRVGVKDPVALEKAIKKTEEELQGCIKDQKTYMKIVDSVQTRLDGALASVAKSKAKLSDLEDSIRKVGKASETDIRKLTIVRKQAGMLQSGCEALRLQRLSLYQRCRMEDIELPTASTEETGQKRAKQAEAASRRRSKRDRDAEDDDDLETDLSRMRTSEAFTSFSEGADGGRKSGGGSKEGHVCIDFAQLPETLRQTAADKSQFQAHKQRAETVVDQLERELESIAPNLKAKDRFSSSEAKLNNTANTLEGARDRARQALTKFTQVKDERVQRFMTCFEKIVDNVDQVYRELTMGTRAQDVSGSAYLSLEDAEEPYNGGTKYHATPPMKRFMTIDLLSGGERTMAALALLFAIHKINPTPFFVLDEVDAALDAANVQKLAQYLHKHRYTCQYLVVSLKDQLYGIADSLVGVYKDVANESSGVLTYDLTTFKD